MSSLTIWYFLWRMSGKTIISFGKIIRLFIRSLWIYRNGGSTMCFSSLKRERWKVDNKNELENLCDNIFDAIQGTFVQKHYVTRILQSKNGNIYLLMRKKRGRLVGVEKKKIHDVVANLFRWHSSSRRFTHDKFF